MPSFIVQSISSQIEYLNNANLCDVSTSLTEEGRYMCNNLIYEQMKNGISVASQFVYNEMVIERATNFLPALENDPGYFEANFILWGIFDQIRTLIWSSITDYLN